MTNHSKAAGADRLDAGGVQRLKVALEGLASSAGTARQRLAVAARTQLAPLRAAAFSDPDDQETFNGLLDEARLATAGVTSTVDGEVLPNADVGAEEAASTLIEKLVRFMLLVIEGRRLDRPME